MLSKDWASELFSGQTYFKVPNCYVVSSSVCLWKNKSFIYTLVCCFKQFSHTLMTLVNLQTCHSPFLQLVHIRDDWMRKTAKESRIHFLQATHVWREESWTALIVCSLSNYNQMESAGQLYQRRRPTFQAQIGYCEVTSMIPCRSSCGVCSISLWRYLLKLTHHVLLHVIKHEEACALILFYRPCN